MRADIQRSLLTIPGGFIDSMRAAEYEQDAQFVESYLADSEKEQLRGQKRTQEG